MTYRQKAAACAAAVALSLIPHIEAEAGEAAQPASDQSSDVQADGVFSLGTMIVVGTPDSDTPGSNDVIDAEKMRKLNRQRVSTALETLPGINLMPGNRGGARNETGVYLRGFDLSRVPVLLDGIPVYVPYDGYLDLNRLLTYDLSKVEVSKGFASVLNGPNAMGGLINLVTRRPTRPLEGNVTIGADFAGNGKFKGYRASANVGSRIDDWYLQGGLSKFTQKFYRLSDDFKPGLYQPTGDRIHSKSDDESLRLKIGVMPRQGDEYAVGFSAGRAEKQAPPYAGLDSTRASFFDWPRYDQQSLYYTGRTRLDQHGAYLKTKLYYNAMQNALNKYDSASYATQFFPSSFSSKYNDYTIGGGAELGLPVFDTDLFAVSVARKRDTHKEANVGQPTSRMEDVTSSVAGEYRASLNDRLSAVLGLGYDYRDPRSAQDPATSGATSFAVKSEDAFNYQAGLTYQVTENHAVYASASHKTRFASMYERYSYRLGFGLPNPALKPEQSTNFEVGYRGRPIEKTEIKIAPFASKVKDYIQNQTVGFSSVPYPHSITQAQNVGSGWFYGLEASVDTQLLPGTDAQLGYTFLRRNIGRLYGTPSHTLFASANVDVGGGFSLIPSAIYQSKRSTVDTGNGLPIGGDLVASLNASYAIDDRNKIEAGVQNLFDRNYYYDDGYPAEGRNFSITYRREF